MVFHADLWMTALADAVAQTPVVVRCVQATADPWWKWLLPTVVQTVVSLLSIAAGVAIAVWSFKRNRQTEHEQWTRDQERAEWSKILSSLTAVDAKIPHVFKNNAWPTMSDAVSQALRNVLPAMRSALFIANRLEDENLIAQFTKFVSSAAEKLQEVDSLTQKINTLCEAHSSGNILETAESNVQWIGYLDQRQAAYKSLYDEFHGHSYEIHQAALRSFVVASDELKVTFSDADPK